MYDELHDLIAEVKSVIAQIRGGGISLPPGFLTDLEAATFEAEALLERWQDEEGRLADREG